MGEKMKVEKNGEFQRVISLMDKKGRDRKRKRMLSRKFVGLIHMERGLGRRTPSGSTALGKILLDQWGSQSKIPW